MAYTLEQAQQHVFRYVKGGADSPSSQIVTDQINRAILGLLTSQYNAGEYGEWVVKVGKDRRTIMLPPEVEVAELISLNGIEGRNPIKPRMKWYRYLRHRCDSEALAQCEPVEADDFGDGHIVDVMPDCPTMLMVYSERPSEAPPTPNDEGARVYVRGIDQEDKPIYTQTDEGAVEGAYFDLLNDRPRLSSYEQARNLYFTEINHLSKPVTRWPVTVAAVEVSASANGTKQINYQPLLTAMPWETTVSRRKYVLNAAMGECNGYVYVFGRARYRPAKHATDILLIQNLEAIRQAILRLEAEDEGDVAKIRHFDQTSRAHLDEGLRRNNGNNQEPIYYEWEPGSTIGQGLTNL